MARMSRPAAPPGGPPAPSLSEVHESVELPSGPGWRRWFAIAGPALMVSVGYMDPGNWATDLAGGSRYGYALLWVLLMSNLMAVLLQGLAARLGIAGRRDLAQANREHYPRWINLPLYALAEIAITATDLAEVIGSAIALQLLFGLPLTAGVLITAADTLLLLALSRFGIRKLELVVVGLVGMIGMGMLVEIVLARPDWGGVAGGLVPTLPDSGALFIAIGILGATVMPHNLYLHSALVQTRRVGRTEGEVRSALRLNVFDSTLALNLAFFINAAILVMAAAVFHRAGYTDVAEIQDAHRLLEPLLGARIAPVAFALALLASGQSSTVTGTLAGQIVMEGYLNIRIRPWLRRLITRAAAVIPALLVIGWSGEGASGELLVLSQVILSLQLPFAIVPLIHFCSDRVRMRSFAIGPATKLAAWTVAVVIVALNLKLVADATRAWAQRAGASAWLVTVPLALAVGALLLYITLEPWLRSALGLAPRPRAIAIHRARDIMPLTPPEPYRRVAIAMDFSGREERLLAEALRLVGTARPAIALFHVVESPAAQHLGDLAQDEETAADAARLEAFADQLRGHGFAVETALGMGHPVRELARLAEAFDADLLILGGHGHRWLRDLVLGTTADQLRHRVRAAVLVVPPG